MKMNFYKAARLDAVTLYFHNISICYVIGEEPKDVGGQKMGPLNPSVLLSIWWSAVTTSRDSEACVYPCA